MMTKKIMIVDDEPHLVELLSAILTTEGYEVQSADSGAAAIEVLKTFQPDLILLDMMMPGMSGRETCEKLRKDPQTKNIKIAFLTVAKFSETGISTLKEMGVVDYITKPFENEDLIKRVKKIVG